MLRDVVVDAKQDDAKQLLCNHYVVSILQAKRRHRTRIRRQAQRCVAANIRHQPPQIALVRVQHAKAGLADAQVAERAGPAVVRVGLAARLARQRVLPVCAPVHDRMLLETRVVRCLELPCGIDAVGSSCRDLLALPGGKTERARVGFA